MRLFSIVLLLVLITSCTLPVKYRPKIDTNRVDIYCLFSAEYESPLYIDDDILNLYLKRDTTYMISIKQYSNLTNFQLTFKGTYHLSDKGLVTFLGEHPFKQPTIQLRESRTFNYRLNDDFSETYKRKQFAYCEYGEIELSDCLK